MDNNMINKNILEACDRYQVKKVVSALSTCVYPDSITYPLSEDKVGGYSHISYINIESFMFCHAY